MKQRTFHIIAGLGFSTLISGCASESQSASVLAGTIPIDGSSTVYPITEAVAEEFKKVHPRVRVEVGVSGTGGGFKKFGTGSTVINDASRPIKSSEMKLATENKVEFIELPIAYDGLTVVVNKDNDFATMLTVAELKSIWAPGSKINNWKQVRSGFPDLPMKLYGPGTDSGTFDYFTKAINGKEGACRSDYTASEDDNVLVNGVSGDKGAVGFFGFAYYSNNSSKLTAVKVKAGDGEPVGPSLESINDGTYKPLSRPIFIYVSKAAASEEHVKTFVDFYLENASSLVGECGYVKLPDSITAAAKKRFAAGVIGSIFADPAARSKSLVELYK